MLLRRITSKFALLIATVLIAGHSAGAQTDKATAVINEMISTLGGKSFLEVREIQATGKVFAIKRDRMAGNDTFLDYVQFPDKQRTEYGTYRIKPTRINNGDSGWTVNDKKIDPQSPAEVRDFQASVKTGFQYLARFVLGRPGLAILYAGNELIDFKRNDVIEFRDSGNFFRLYVDQQSHLPTKMEVRRSGETFLREEQFANWHDFQGIRTALYIIHFKDGDRTQEIRFDNVSYNPGMADSLFAPPTAR